ncbi:transmembrane protein 135-like [Drosophila innubila]|uniref:transmembrane protein 135-like n=1 Tax=Drosophila innubila TaxID=198719 RepID=UPI00148C3959|nr:transmembrane protein 135-like [Drosophila innubila]
MAAQSKLMEAAINCSCRDYLHPWTSSCVNAAAGIMLTTIPTAFRTYTMVYLFALIVRMRIPTLKDLKRTIEGIFKSTAFLTTNAYGFNLCVCLFRLMLGRFYFSTIAYIPTFVASIISLFIERPERRTPLALYVANVSTESLWKMLEARGIVRSIPNGQVLVLGCSITALLYMYRLGVHQTKVKDATFKALQLLIGKEEQGPIKESPPKRSSQQPLNFSNISAYVQLYQRLRNTKHHSCPHRLGCSSYAVVGGLKPFLGGVGVQVGLKLLLSIPNMIKMKMDWRKQIFNKGNLKLGLALGSYSLLYKMISCGLRHSCGYDSALFAIPAGLLGSIGLLQFPNITISMYVMWKALQLLYNWGHEEGVLPNIPYFNMILYSACTALLFHCAILEPSSMRSSYYKFLMDISGTRLCRFDISPFDAYGLGGQGQRSDVIKRLKIDMSQALPKIPLVV